MARVSRDRTIRWKTVQNRTKRHKAAQVGTSGTNYVRTDHSLVRLVPRYSIASRSRSSFSDTAPVFSTESSTPRVNPPTVSRLLRRTRHIRRSRTCLFSPKVFQGYPILSTLSISLTASTAPAPPRRNASPLVPQTDRVTRPPAALFSPLFLRTSPPRMCVPSRTNPELY